ncbi:MAG: formate/nitrite transporter family protein, partial [Muribaculaceae bacterium]|nr:formate/nitrite transporter family protein [Muribaculaceae bacterium]
MKNLIRSAIMAGICIGIAGFGYLAVGGIVGAVTFAFGLLAVVHYRLKLYTGTAGFFAKGELLQLCTILAMNIVGCLLVALMARMSPMPLQEAAQHILEGRLNAGIVQSGVLAIGCGFIMTTAVKWGREGKFLPLLFGVPLFIICGFPHCIADAFYYLCVPLDYLTANAGQVLLLYASIVLGNFIGCNLYRLLLGTN